MNFLFLEQFDVEKLNYNFAQIAAFLERVGYAVS